MITNYIMIYLYIGAVWSAYFTGVTVFRIMAKVKSGELAVDWAVNAALVAVFIINFITWPWSICRNWNFLWR